MAVGYVGVFAQQEDQDNAAAAWSVAVTTATTTGNFGALLVYNEDALVTAVADSKGNTWAKAFDLAASGSLHGNLWYANFTSGLTTSDTITVTKSAAGNRPNAAAGIELSAITASSPLDVSVTANGTGTTQTTGTTAATSVADSMAVAVWINDTLLAWSAQTNGFSEDVDFGTLAGGGGGGRLCIGHKALVATGTAESTATRAAGAGVVTVGGMAVFKGSGGGGGGGTTVKQLAALGVG